MRLPKSGFEAVVLLPSDQMAPPLVGSGETSGLPALKVADIG
jgi:hypothetical protein